MRAVPALLLLASCAAAATQFFCSEVVKYAKLVKPAGLKVD